MATSTFTANDLITAALRNIGAYEAGETLSANDSADALQTLNIMLDSWSTDHLSVIASLENLFTYTPGQYQYTIGNYTGGTFTGTLVSGSPTISGVTVPNGLTVGGDITDSQGAIPAGTTVLSIGATTVTLSANATFTVAAPETFTYTIPGNFKMDRPLRISAAFTRITASGTTALDYPIEIINQDQYTAIGLKGLAGPWPICLYYVSTWPLGNLYVYPNPSSAGQLHLWTDQVFTAFSTLTQSINMPQGYARAIIKNLALELAPEYGKQVSALLVKQAKEAKDLIKSLNEEPVIQAFYDRDIVRTRRNDAGWIMHGGFN